MRVSIMQPYFLPYLGYWQLISNSDKFVVYDDIEYTKKGWVNRNRFSLMGNIESFSLPLKKDSDYLPVNKRFLSKESKKFNEKTLRKIIASYRNSVNFEVFFPVVEGIFNFEEDNLFNFVNNSINEIVKYLDINTDLVVSSDVEFDNSLKSQDKVISICKSLNAKQYLNLSGGMSLYDHDSFNDNNIDLIFMKKNSLSDIYDGYIDNLSIIDLAFNLEKKVLQNLMRNEFEYLEV